MTVFQSTFQQTFQEQCLGELQIFLWTSNVRTFLFYK